MYVRGFGVAKSVNSFIFTWTEAKGKIVSKSFKPTAVDPDWGKKNSRSYLMGQASLQTEWECKDICPTCEIIIYASYGSI